MNEKDFNKLVNNSGYQVFLFKSQMPSPYFFAVHCWFVVNRKGKISRWELGLFSRKAEKSWSHVHKNVVSSPVMGMGKRVDKLSGNHPGILIGSVSGSKDSLADKMGRFILDRSGNYLYKDEYCKYPGPNSNTYVQWVLDNFSKSCLKLPFNAFGKNFMRNGLIKYI